MPQWVEPRTCHTCHRGKTKLCRQDFPNLVGIFGSPDSKFRFRSQTYTLNCLIIVGYHSEFRVAITFYRHNLSFFTNYVISYFVVCILITLHIYDIECHMVFYVTMRTF